MGRIGIKVWIYKGEILPPAPEIEEEEELLENIELRVESGSEDEDLTEAFADGDFSGLATGGSFNAAT